MSASSTCRPPAGATVVATGHRQAPAEALVGKADVTTVVVWKDAPEEHDYPAAASYLSLLAEPDLVAVTVTALQSAPLTHYKAKDILRASGLPLLPPDDPHVAKDLAKVRGGHKLSPVLLVRGALTRGFALQVADGYHRVCASYHHDENTDIPCRLAELPG